MPAWNPSETRRKFGLTLSAVERAAVDANMAPLARDADGFYQADAVFEGGGVLGIAFLGAVRLCQEIGLRWHGLAGTSAGALTATLLAADFNIDQLEQILGQLDFMHFLSRKSSRLIFNGEPGNDLGHPVQMITNLALVHELGEYSTDPIKTWLDEVLRWAGIQTFGDVWDRNRVVNDRQLKVVVSDLTRREMTVLPDDLDPATPAAATQGRPYRPPLTVRQRQMSVAEAVRLSMSIPFFFLPGALEMPTGASTIVDGGILSNFPLWLYDDDSGTPPEWPTFGFRLTDRAEDRSAPIQNVTDLFSAMLKTMMVAHDRRYLSQRHQGRVVDLDLTGLGLSATQFNLNNEQKDALYAAGYQSAKTFFVRQWSWPRHLAQRGH